MSAREESADLAASAAEAAALAASLTVADRAPSVIELGQHLAAVENAQNRYDEATLACDDTYSDDKAILGDRAEALRALIATLPAKSLQDAAVIIRQAGMVAGRAGADGSLPARAQAAFDSIERMLLGALPFVAEAAGLHMEAMQWDGEVSLRLHRFRGVGVG